MRSNDRRPLSGHEFRAVGHPWATRLLRDLGAEVVADAARVRGPAAAWAASGAMQVSGAAHGAPLLAPGCPAFAASGAIAACAALAPVTGLARLDLDGAALLGERAALTGFTRHAPWSPGGSARAVRCADGWVVVNLARADDRDLVAAVLELDTAPPDQAAAWAACDSVMLAHRTDDLVERATLLGLPLAALPAALPTGGADHAPWTVTGRSGARRSRTGLRVVDLSSLWAGPLAGSLLALMGAEVFRVESSRRPDGSRSGSRPFDDLLHAGQRSVALDVTTASGRADLQRLVASADVVITSARRRALGRLGLDPVSSDSATQVRVAVTAYGLDADRVGYGDDCAMAGGLLGIDRGVPVPVGDALADPLTGLHATVAALAGVAAGGSWVVDIALAQVARAIAGPLPDGEVHLHDGAWCVAVDGEHTRVAAPRARAAAGPARALGADTDAVLTAIGASQRS